MTNQEIEFAELEHKGGQHQEFQENCPTCFSENLLVKESYNKYAHEEAFEHSGQIDDPSWSNNPLD